MKRMKYSAVYFFILLISSIFLLGCSEDESSTGSGGGSPGPNEIFIQNTAFAQGTRTIAVGTTIKWINKDGFAHTVTSGTPGAPSGLFNSGNLGPNGEFSFTFTQAGTFSYYCSIHPSMTGTITVQ